MARLLLLYLRHGILAAIEINQTGFGGPSGGTDALPRPLLVVVENKYWPLHLQEIRARKLKAVGQLKESGEHKFMTVESLKLSGNSR